MCDFSLNDDLAIVSEPIGINKQLSKNWRDSEFADLFLD